MTEKTEEFIEEQLEEEYEEQLIEETEEKKVEQPGKLRFKNAQFSYAPGGKKFVFKSLKQILTMEKALQLPEGAVTYATMNAPPSLLPAKKYSDISGLAAPYTDPHTKLRYHNAEEYAIVKELPSDIVQGYLQLRGYNSVVG